MLSPTHRRILLALVPALLCYCGAVEPTGPLKGVMEGRIFDGPPRDPVQEQKDEQVLRETQRQTPRPKEVGGPLRFKVPF